MYTCIIHPPFTSRWDELQLFGTILQGVVYCILKKWIVKQSPVPYFRKQNGELASWADIHDLELCKRRWNPYYCYFLLSNGDNKRRLSSWWSKLNFVNEISVTQRRVLMRIMTVRHGWSWRESQIPGLPSYLAAPFIRTEWRTFLLQPHTYFTLCLTQYYIISS
jgi:hypothetical protein